MSGVGVNNINKAFEEYLKRNFNTIITSSKNYQLFDNFYFNENKDIWDCPINISLWFSNMYHDPDQIKIISDYILGKVHDYLSKTKTTQDVKLHELMFIDDSNYYNCVYHHIIRHLIHVTKNGFPNKLAPEYVVKKMCEYYYKENMEMSKFILEALI